MKETMIHELGKKCGGKFKLTVLLQKRLLEINRGQQKPEEHDSRTPLQIAMDEIKQGRIFLEPPKAEGEESSLILPVQDTIEQE